MTNWLDRKGESRQDWDRNADFWDQYMGESNNRFHREIVVPQTLKLLEPRPGQHILDIGCGNGNFSRLLAGMGVKVTAFDFSERMIENARKRSSASPENPTYRVVDAADAGMLMELGPNRFDSAVSNMALMDMADIRPLSESLRRLLKPGGRFVFSIAHPCFQTPGLRKVVEKHETGKSVEINRYIAISRYIHSEAFEGISIKNQPGPSLYFHRPLSEVLNRFFMNGFVADGMAEPVFEEDESCNGFDWFEIPPALIVRLINNAEG